MDAVKPSETPILPPRSYRATFAKTDSATRYDDVVYAPDSSAEILWSVERDILVNLARSAIAGRPDPTYLDFACGTGRILSTLEAVVPSATGIDVSAAMLERARTKCKSATLIQKDITADKKIEGQYDLITAMRFLTNAEPDLREAALRQLYRRLKDGGTLLINTHGNPWSYRLILLPYHWLRDRMAGRKLFGYLSTRETKELLTRCGFRVERVIGMGFVPEKALPLVPKSLARFIERRAAGVRGIQATGLNQLFVCTKSPLRS